MSWMRKLCLATLCSLASLSAHSVASAGVLDGHPDATTYSTYSGSQSFVNGTLAGTLDYAVFSASEFATAFPTSTWAPGGPVVYAYQLENTGAAVISTEIVGVTNDVTVPHDIDAFENAVGEIAPSSAAFGPTTAEWSFIAPNTIATAESSQILVFSSPNVPMFGASLTVDTGQSALLTMIPTPSPDAVPEPTSFVLLSLGAMWVLSIRRRR